MWVWGFFCFVLFWWGQILLFICFRRKGGGESLDFSIKLINLRIRLFSFSFTPYY